MPKSADRSTSPGGVQYREATEDDAGAIAALHAESWRRHYRGAYLDSYLDGDIVPERLEVWTIRLSPPRSNQCTVCADLDGEVIGFAHTLFGHDPMWGAQGNGSRHRIVVGDGSRARPKPTNRAPTPVGARSEHRGASVL